MKTYYLLFSSSSDRFWKLLLGDFAHVSVLIVPTNSKPYIDGANWTHRYHLPVPVRNGTMLLRGFTAIVQLPHGSLSNKNKTKSFLSLFNCVTYVNKLLGLDYWTPRGLYKHFKKWEIHPTSTEKGVKEWQILK